MQDTLDFCVGFNGRNADVLSRVCFGSLVQNCDLSHAIVHVVDNGVPSDTEILKVQPGWNQYKIYDNWVPDHLDRYHTDSMIPQFEMCRWIVDNCGTCQWCVISDFDIIYWGDMLSMMRFYMRDDVGIIGSHAKNHSQVTPLFAINRAAYKKRRVDFNGGSRTCRVPGWSRCESDAVDLGILLAEDLADQGYRWQKFAPEPEWEHIYYNMGGGGSYHNQKEFESMRFRALALCEKYGW